MNQNNDTEVDTVELDQDATDSDTPEPRKSMSRKRIASIFVIGSVLAGGAAAGYVFGIDPMIQKKQASSTISKIAEDRGPLTAHNTESITFAGTGDAPSNSENQKALASNGIVTNPAAFVFTNGKNVGQKQVDLYVDFSSQRSRDFIVLNQLSLKSMIEMGDIVLNIHPVPTSDAFSVYAAESLAETFVNAPEKAWPMLMKLMEISTTLDAAAGEESKETILELITTATESIGVPNVTDDTIKSGIFASWILTVGDDSRVKNEFGLPGLYVNGGIVDQNTVDIHDSATLKKYLQG